MTCDFAPIHVKQRAVATTEHTEVMPLIFIFYNIKAHGGYLFGELIEQLFLTNAFNRHTIKLK